MANTDTELKKLNKTVDDAVNILKLYVGNSAQMKSMDEKQRQAVEKWFDVVTEEEEQQKQKRKFTERLRDENGKFIKKQDNQAKKFMGMADTVKGMFKTMTLGVTNGIGNMVQGVKTHMSSFMASLKSHFLGLFGEESEWFDMLGSIKDSIAGFGTSIFKFFFGKTPKWAGSMVKTLKDIYKLQIKEMKMDFLEGSGKKKKGNVWATLGVILFAIAAGIGAWLHRKLIAITSSIPVFGKIAKLFQGLKKMPFFAKMGTLITTLRGNFDEFLKFAKKMPILGRLIKGLKFGFKWLGWPITLLLSVFDFIKGYSETEGTMWEKVKGGLWKAIEGFIELPIKFIGWIIEKVSGWFGVEVENVGQTIMDNLKKFLNFYLEYNPITFLADAFTGNLDKWIDPLMDAISPIVTGIIDFFKTFWNSAVEWMKGKIPAGLPFADNLAAGLDSMKIDSESTPTISPTEAVTQTEKAKIQNDVQSAKNMEQAVDAMKEMEKNRKSDTTRNTLAAMNQNNQSGGGGEVKQIPDEIDNGLVSVKNYSGELD